MRALILRAEEVLDSHKVRSPQRAALAEVRRQLDEALGLTGVEIEDGLGHILMLRPKVDLALGDPIAAVESLRAAAERKPELTEAAMQFAFRLLQRSQRELFGKDTVNVAGTVERFASAVEELGSVALVEVDRARLRAIALLLRNRVAEALDLALDNAEQNVGAWNDLSIILRRALHQGPDRSLSTAALARLSRLLDDENSAPEQMRQETRLAIGVHLSTYPGMDAGRFLDPVLPYVGRTEFDALLSLAQTEKLFHVAEDALEPVREAVVERFCTLLRSEQGLSASQVYRVLQLLALRVAYWRDAAWREMVNRLCTGLVEGRTDTAAFMLRATVAFIEGDEAKTEAEYRQLLDLGLSLGESGATSFFATLPDLPKPSLFTSTELTFEEAPKAPRAVLCCADSRFFKRFARTYARTLRATGDDIRLHFHIADPDDACLEMLATMRKRMGDISASFETAPQKLPAYFASMRFLHLPHFLERVASRVLVTDIDITFRSAVSPMFADPRIAEADLVMRYYERTRAMGSATRASRRVFRHPHMHPWGQVNAAYLAVADTPAGRRAADIIAEDMAGHLDAAVRSALQMWWIDQNALYYSLKRLRAEGGIRIANIEEIGMPYGSYDYSDVRTYEGDSPVFTRMAG
ncbi:hypothetical protein IAI18_10830 [Acetobacteraceae bacterium H6797]|nr:hypothetical protein [Acetobacteraceae bacterium H6797]